MLGFTVLFPAFRAGAPLSAPLSRAAASHSPLSRSFAIMGRKPGVSPPEELASFVEQAGGDLVVVDVRNPDFEKEPGDGETNKTAKIGDPSRKAAVNIVFDRATASMDLSPLDGKDKATPIISHCGGGGRGQKAKEYLEANGFTNVKNGGGPEDAECWAVFGSK
ncbi:hypothetical protein EMIHUDRAFT_441775 [Emiliania huxleyi CCMP1516]|uniref:Rhodanese domain-containing protein n=2 Tax=Emiliania huxleyi TaxID=2903 RepID=A0A0D3KAB6_EMIH1|nr:hypothetical protein EMIHUDRAFT_436846 [Emiliania huxleyi CCMP1516]XP_005785130.1 hypothetical protein EMIHUDRAFT_441775 [Emiliania huxleyi CCMP1516]EOD14329.1 hypothetical protein EMIHUDRAFT_436846 [Emiliania huxleyi CCMP1516]EOD32701.1 hypothetical protein EMIHUDRAFT_441775 [Emiliania huxleyi CCMP1516]|mmetsp:Transcript_17663/g.52301  ORF Transcript_17663/g.52301 Transcript_17663/m.52301 type:complete len:164 (-) Transcript_17663:99-590(-)|eukprot:XP_005766758.1 hypothetical protein EMIHUDRAFT_436846 [Emiliania huxleyi CCMP1516]